MKHIHFSKLVLFMGLVCASILMSQGAQAQEPGLRMPLQMIDTTDPESDAAHCLNDNRAWRALSGPCSSVMFDLEAVLYDALPEAATLSQFFIQEAAAVRSMLSSNPAHMSSARLQGLNHLLDLQTEVGNKLAALDVVFTDYRNHPFADQQPNVIKVIAALKEIKKIADESPENFY